MLAMSMFLILFLTINLSQPTGHIMQTWWWPRPDSSEMRTMEETQHIFTDLLNINETYQCLNLTKLLYQNLDNSRKIQFFMFCFVCLFDFRKEMQEI